MACPKTWGKCQIGLYFDVKNLICAIKYYDKEWSDSSQTWNSMKGLKFFLWILINLGTFELIFFTYEYKKRTKIQNFLQVKINAKFLKDARRELYGILNSYYIKMCKKDFSFEFSTFDPWWKELSHDFCIPMPIAHTPFITSNKFTVDEFDLLPYGP